METRWQKSQVADRWREYCEELYNYRGQVDNNIPVKLANVQDQEKDPPITYDEVVEAVRKPNKGNRNHPVQTTYQQNW